MTNGLYVVITFLTTLIYFVRKLSTTYKSLGLWSFFVVVVFLNSTLTLASGNTFLGPVCSFVKSSENIVYIYEGKGTKKYYSSM